MPALPSSPATLTSSRIRVSGVAVTRQLGERGLRGDRVDQLDVRQDRLDLARLQLADEVPAVLGVRGRLGLELLGAVLAEQREPGLAEHAHLLQRDVLDRGEDLDLGGVAPRVGDRLAHPFEIGVDAGGVEPRDQARHMTPDWRPVTPRSRRWEKSRPAGRTSCRAPCRAPRCRAPAAARAPPRPDPGSGRGGRRRPRNARGPPRRPRNSSRGRPGRARRRPGRRRRRRAAPARPRRRSRPPSGRQPQCSAATAPGAASRTGRQSAVKTTAAASRQRRRLPVLLRVGPLSRRRLARAADGRAVDLAPVTEARPGMTDGLPQPAAVLVDVLTKVVGEHAEVQRGVRAFGDAAAGRREDRSRVRQVGDDLVVLPMEGCGKRRQGSEGRAARSCASRSGARPSSIATVAR